MSCTSSENSEQHEGIRTTYEESVNNSEFLRTIYWIGLDEMAFSTKELWDKIIVDSKQTTELKNLIDLKAEETKINSAEDIKNIWRDIVSNTYDVASVISSMETQIIKKVRELSGYDQGDGIFTPDGSISNMYGLVLARYKRFPNIKSTGTSSLAPLVIFTSEESQYSLKKAAHWLGFGMDNCCIVKTNERGQILIADLIERIKVVKASGRLPFFVNATAGSTVLGAFDDLEAVADVCEKYDLWLHIDARSGGSCLLSSKYGQLLKGLKRSDSFTWNPHETLGTPLKCSLFITRHREILPQCKSDISNDVNHDTGDKNVQFNRKLNVFKLWLMFKACGDEKLSKFVDSAIDMSKEFIEMLKDEPGFRLVLPGFQYSTVCFWYVPEKMRRSSVSEETEVWKKQLYEIAPRIKEQLDSEYTTMLGYSSVQYRNIGNFFRIVFTKDLNMSGNVMANILSTIKSLADEI